MLKVYSVLLLCSVVVWAQPLTVVTLGDSLTAGDGDDGIGGGYPARLAQMLDTSHPGSTILNLAISGDTSDDLINKQLDLALDHFAVAPAGHTKVALVWIGSNDLFGLYNYVCDQDYANNYSACESDTFGYYRDNIRQILGSLTASADRVYMALLDDQSRRPVITDATLRGDTFPLISEEDIPRMAAQVVIYNDEIGIQAAAVEAITVDFFQTMIFEQWDTLSDDGNHPNGAGYDAIAEIWHEALGGEVGPTPDSERWIVHVTSPHGGFQTRILATNQGTQPAQFTLNPRTADGELLSSVSRMLSAGASLDLLSADLFGAEAVSHFSVLAPQSVTLTVGYRLAEGVGATAHVNESTRAGSHFLFYPGEQAIVFDGMALVNLGSEESEIMLSFQDTNGSVTFSSIISEGLVPKAKQLATLDGLALDGVASIHIHCSQPTGFMFLRGTRPGTEPGYLYQIDPVVIE